MEPNAEHQVRHVWLINLPAELHAAAAELGRLLEVGGDELHVLHQAVSGHGEPTAEHPAPPLPASESTP